MNRLQTALAEWDRYKSEPAWTMEGLVVIADLFAAAARRWLDLQPQECGTCGGSGLTIDNRGLRTVECLVCHGSGHVYKTETVERIAKAIWRSDVLDVNERRWEVLQEWQRSDYRSQAIAVLDALNGADPPDKET